MNLTGNWIKISGKECTEKYPHRLSFEHNGLYRGEASSSAREHPVWDVGTYEVDVNSIRMSTSNDAVIDYQVKLEGTKLSIKDANGCTIEYKREGHN